MGDEDEEYRSVVNMTKNERKRAEAESAVYEILMKASGNAMHYNDLIKLVNACCRRYISNKALTQLMRKHISVGYIVNKRQREQGVRHQIWTIDPAISKETFCFWNGNGTKAEIPTATIPSTQGEETS